MRRLIVAVLVLVAAFQTYQLATGEDEDLEPASSVEEAQAEANASGPTLPDGTPAPQRLVFQECYEHFAFFAVPASAYEDRVPEGFSLVSFFGEPTGASAELIVYGQACQLPDGSEVARAATYLPVDPPEAWAHPDDEAGHDLVLSMTTDAEQVAAVNEAWGFADVAAEGEIALETEEAPAARAGHLEAEGGDVSLTLETTVQGQPGEAEGGQSRMFALGEDGAVTGAKDIEWTAWQGMFGSAAVEGSTDAGMPETAPVPPGGAAHAWAFEQTQTYVDLPPREQS